MGGADSRTYGFGRVSARTRPSPYSLVEPPGPRRSGAEHRTLRRRGYLLAATFLAMLVALGLTALLSLPKAAPEQAKPIAQIRQAPALTDEALRLSRSAIALARYTQRP